MTANQRDEAIRGYNEREKMREEARAVEAARLANEAEARAAEERRREDQMRRRVEGI